MEMKRVLSLRTDTLWLCDGRIKAPIWRHLDLKMKSCTRRHKTCIDSYLPAFSFVSWCDLTFRDSNMSPIPLRHIMDRHDLLFKELTLNTVNLNINRCSNRNILLRPLLCKTTFGTQVTDTIIQSVGTFNFMDTRDRKHNLCLSLWSFEDCTNTFIHFAFKRDTLFLEGLTCICWDITHISTFMMYIYRVTFSVLLHLSDI